MIKKNYIIALSIIVIVGTFYTHNTIFAMKGKGNASPSKTPLQMTLKKLHSKLELLTHSLANLKNNLFDLQKKLDVSPITAKITGSQVLEGQLKAMGYTNKDIMRVIAAGTTDLNAAITWINENPEVLDESQKLKEYLTDKGFDIKEIEQYIKAHPPITVVDETIKNEAVNWILAYQSNVPSSSPPSQPQQPPTPSIPPIPQIPNVGLTNANGNDCFFSASFQVLSQVDSFITELEKLPDNDKTDVQREFLDFIKSLRGSGSGKYKSDVNATKVFRAFITENDMPKTLRSLRIGQQDAQEFLSAFLDILTELSSEAIEDFSFLFLDFFSNVFEHNKQPKMTEFINAYRKVLDRKKLENKTDFLEIIKATLNNLTEKPMYKAGTFSTLDQQISKIFDDSEEKIINFSSLSKGVNDIRKLFTVNEASAYRCQQCNNKRIGGSQAALLLSLPIGNASTTLEQCLQNYFSTETLSGSNAVYCKKCTQNSPTNKQLIVQDPLPQILTVHLKRFDFGGLAQKLSHAVQFPITLNIGTPIISKGAVSYKLFGFVSHGGGTGGGHYWAHTKDRFDGKWRCYNDSSISELTEAAIQTIANQNVNEIGLPYLLFYEKMS